MAGISDQDDFQKTALRVPKELHAKIIASAKSNNRTMNAEIIQRLEESFIASITDETHSDTKKYLYKVIKNAVDELGCHINMDD